MALYTGMHDRHKSYIFLLRIRVAGIDLMHARFEELQIRVVIFIIMRIDVDLFDTPSSFGTIS